MRVRRVLFLCALSIGLGAGSEHGVGVRAAPPEARADADPPKVAPEKPKAGPTPKVAGFDPRKSRLEEERHVVDVGDGRRAVLTLDAGLQAHVERDLRLNNVPRAGVVAIEPKSGRVLAYVSRDDGTFGSVDVARDASAPAASVFKLVTASALLREGVSPKAEACYHGGLHGLGKADIEDGPRDHRCDSLSAGVARSLNAVFAKLALKHLDEKKLGAMARAFGFGERVPFDAPVEKSALDVPLPSENRLEFGKMSAGFFHTTLSPVHGAVLAATFANEGAAMRPYVIDRVVARDGAVLSAASPRLWRDVLMPKEARAVGKMMEGTVTVGTARGAFMDQRGWPYLPEVAVAGKTGTLSDAKPYKGYTWWVGYAPAEKPEIAVAALVVNTPLWRTKASQVAREALRYYLVERPKREKRAEKK